MGGGPERPPAAASAGEGLVAGLSSREESRGGFCYDYVLTAGSGVMRGTVWREGNLVKTETLVAGRRLISYFDGDAGTVLVYFPDRNRGVRLRCAGRPAAVPEPGEWAVSPGGEGVRVVGRAVYDGVPCRVVVGSGRDRETRVWLREDSGLPVRVEITTTGGERTVMEYRNCRPGPLPPDTFALPPGVEVVDVG